MVFENCIPMNPSSMSFFYSTPDEISGVLRELKKNSALDDNSTKFIKFDTEHVSRLLSSFYQYVCG